MSRIGKQPVLIPDKVKVGITNTTVLIEGPKGKVSKIFAPVVKITVADQKVTFAPTEDSRFANAMYGTVRSIVAGMVKGVTEGYSKDLEIQGVGFKANLKGKQLDLALGYSHPIEFALPEGVAAKVDKNQLILSGIDRQALGAAASKIRSFYSKGASTSRTVFWPKWKHE
jgi:large subunit ribosomal protein L6